MKITKRRLRQIIESLPYVSGQPWTDPKAPVGVDRTEDDLDRELTDDEIEATMGWQRADPSGDTEFWTGYDDAINGIGLPVDASPDYKAGWKDGSLNVVSESKSNLRGKNNMKITKRQLRKIINESMRAPSAEMAAGAAERAATNWYSDRHETLADRKFADSQAFDKDDEDYDRAEFTRGEQDGFNERPYDNPSGNTSYQSGYEDGSHAASMNDDKDEYRGFHEGTSLEDMPASWQQVLGDCLGDESK